MSNEKSNKVLLGSGLALALTSSLCCIVPTLAIISGTSSAVATFSWAASLRPYLLGATVLILGFAFYQAYKPQPKDGCGCETKRGFLQSKSFLWIIAVVSILLSAFPYYAKYLEPRSPQQQVANHLPGLQQTVLHLQGMDCEACEGHVNNSLLKKKGVQQVNTSYPQGTVTIKFDSTQIPLQQLAAAIENEIGYKVISQSSGK